MGHSRSEYSTTHAVANKKEHRLPKKILVENARAADVVLPPRAQLHIRPEEFLHEDDDYHTPETCSRCAMEMDPDYGVDDNGFCYPVVIDTTPFVPR